MAILKIWETVRTSTGLPVISPDARMAYQEVDFSAGEARSDPFAETTGIISVLADVDCAVRINGDDATTDDFPVIADEREDFAALPSGTISVIAV